MGILVLLLALAGIGALDAEVSACTSTGAFDHRRPQCGGLAERGFVPGSEFRAGPSWGILSRHVLERPPTYDERLQRATDALLREYAQ